MRRKILKWWRKAPWLTLSALLAGLYLVGFLTMWWAEPAANPIRSLATYTYFYVVTIATVGYGDVVPVTAAGRAATAAIAFGGIGSAAVALGQILSSVGEYVRRRDKGLLGFDMQDHIVIFGNRGAETAALIQRLIADQQTSGSVIVLCSHSTVENPFPESIEFVRGDLTSSDVLARACVAQAAKIIIHAGTDYESISIALAVAEVNRTAPIVVKANDPGKEVDIERVDRTRVVCVKALDVPMIVREIHNPGITQVLENLLAADGQDLRSILVPAGTIPFQFGRLAHRFREMHGAILIGIRRAGAGVNSGAVLNPPFDARVEGGMFLDYISPSPVQIDWATMD